MQECKINFNSIVNLENGNNEKNLDIGELVKYINTLMSLMFDSWNDKMHVMYICMYMSRKKN